MRALTDSRHIFVFSAPAPRLLMKDTENYYRECRIAGAASVEVERQDQPAVVISATRYLADDVTVGAVDAGGVLQVVCVLGDGQRIVMREFTDWISYTVHRAQP